MKRKLRQPTIYLLYGVGFVLLVCISFAVGVILDKVIKIICSLFKSCSWKGVVVANIKNGKK